MCEPLEPSAFLLGLAIDANARPGNRFEAGRRNFVFAFHADSISSLFNPMDGLFDRPEEFGVSLFESKSNVKVTFLAGLVDPITALGAGLRGRRSGGR